MFWACRKKDEYRMAKKVLMVEVSRGRVRGRPRLGWIDGVKVALGNRGMTVEVARYMLLNESDAAIFAFPCVLLDLTPMLCLLSPAEWWDAIT